MWTDILGCPLSKGDYVIYYSNIYQITELIGTRKKGQSSVAKILLVDQSDTTRSVKKYCFNMCKVETEDVLLWKIKRGH